jgi:hypothetical protein
MNKCGTDQLSSQWRTNSSDVEILKRLADRVNQIASTTENTERRTAWCNLHDLKASRPMILIEAGEIIRLIDFEKMLRCSEPWAREIESQLQSAIWRFEELRDDAVVEPFIGIPWRTEISNFGVASIKHEGGSSEFGKGSRTWDSPIQNISRDMHKLRHRTFSVDKETTLSYKHHLEKIFNGILTVEITGGYTWSYGMTNVLIDLIGLENFLMSMYDDPDGLHRMMSFLRDDFMVFLTWQEENGLVNLNNRNNYVGSGSCGYTRDLPQKDYRLGRPARLKDTWMLSESQETVNVSPEMFEKFVFPYQQPLIKRFGLCYYGCCEPVHTRWDILKKIPNLRSISISPWCDQSFMAQALGKNYVFSRKANPTLISMEMFDEDLIRTDLRTTLQTTKDCNLEIIMKDIHTLRNEFHRAARWVQIAREESSKIN